MLRKSASFQNPPGSLTAIMYPRVRIEKGRMPLARPAPGLYDGAMPHDEKLAERLRVLLDGEPQLTEKKMFGGIAFLIGGNMAISASGQGGLLVRVDPSESDRLVATTNAEVAVMRGRPMDGWLRVTADDVRTRRRLATWTALGTAYARSLPSKQ